MQNLYGKLLGRLEDCAIGRADSLHNARVWRAKIREERAGMWRWALAVFMAGLFVAPVTARPANAHEVADVSLDIQGPESVDAGETFAYVLTVHNKGPADATNTHVFHSPDTMSRVVAVDDRCSVRTSRSVACYLGTLTPGQTTTVAVTMRVPETVQAGTVLRSYAVADSPTTYDPNLGNNGSHTRASVDSQADLALVMAGPETLAPGEPAAYTVRVANRGGASAEQVALTPRLDPRLSGDDGQQTRQELGPGEEWTVRIDARLDPDAEPGSPVRSSATVTTTSPEANDGDNTAAATGRTGTGRADLTVTTVGPAQVEPGKPYDQRVRIANAGPASARDVTATLKLDRRLTIRAAPEACRGKVTGAGPTCRLGTIRVGERRDLTVRLTARREPGVVAPLSFGVTVGSSSSDPDSSTNTAAQVIPLPPVPAPPPPKQPPPPKEPPPPAEPPVRQVREPAPEPPAPAPPEPAPREPEPAPPPQPPTPEPPPEPPPETEARLAAVPEKRGADNRGGMLSTVAVAGAMTSMLVAVRMFTRR